MAAELTSKGGNVLVSKFCKVVRCNDSLKFSKVQYENLRRSTTNLTQLLTGCSGRVLNVRLLQSECDIEKKEQLLAVSKLWFCQVLLLVWNLPPAPRFLFYSRFQFQITYCVPLTDFSRCT